MAITRSILSFFVFHILFGTIETIMAFIKGAGFFKCCHPLWAITTIIIPFMPGIVGVPWFLWQACHKKRPCRPIIWDIVKFLAFPLMIFLTNCRSLITLCRLNSEHEPRFEKCVVRAMELKVLKAVFESCTQALLQVAIIMRSNKIEKYNFFDVLVILFSLISISITCSKHINYEIYFMNESHFDGNLLRTVGNTVLYFFIVPIRVFSWALIWSYYGTVLSLGTSV